MTTSILVWSPLDQWLLERLRGVPGTQVTAVAGIDDLTAGIGDADAMVMLGHLYTAPVAQLLRERGQRLRWLQLTTAGYDGISFHGVPPHITVTNAGHSHAPMVAEHAVMLLSALVRRLPCFAVPQARHEFSRAIRLPLATLEDATVAVIGFGGIGQQIARRLSSFGARVIGVSRSGAPHPLAAEMRRSSELHAVLADADAMVIAAALTPETERMIDGAALGTMKAGGVLVNVARGRIVDTAALIHALRSGHLAGAGLDVTDPEPLPPDHPLWDCPNLIITPHVSGIGSAAVRRRIAEVIIANLGRFRMGHRLSQIVAGPQSATR